MHWLFVKQKNSFYFTLAWSAMKIARQVNQSLLMPALRKKL